MSFVPDRAMKCLIAFSFVCAWSFGFCEFSTDRNLRKTLFGGAKTLATAAVETVDDTLKAIPFSEELIGKGCVKPDFECPNPNITFWYYTRSKPNEGVKLSVDDEASFDKINKNQHPWKVMIHGYTKSKNEIPNPQLRSAYFKHGEYNLISVDYEPLARDKCYVSAVQNVPLVAKCTAQLITALSEKGFFQPRDLHVIGYSLGAQVAGQIGKSLKEPLNRVTGLDPASPLFDGTVNEKLTDKAANFVDVIHTNAMVNGMYDPSGHVDFYVNGGLNQPGCLTDSNKTLAGCSHDRSPLYFAESINSPEGFWGVPCKNTLRFYTGNCDNDESKMVIMGEFTPHTSRGWYYLKTTDKAPFALGKRLSA